MITPATTEDRIREIDAIEAAFIYMVASAATTGKNIANDTQQQQYFERISAMQLKHPTVVGFGISNQQQFDFACRYANGAIIGSAFIKALADSEDVAATVKEFVKQVSGE